VTARRGLFLPPFDAFADPALVGVLAEEAEEAGWDGVFVWDHLLYAPPVTAIADPWICCAAIAARTERVLFGPMVTPLARRRPHVLARQAASLAVMSGGRLVLGFGLGDDWGSGEFGRFGDEKAPRVRAAMLDEGLDLLTALLSGEEVAHAGAHYTADGVRFLPAPASPVPIWIAGRYGNAAPVRRAARYDGFFPIGVPDPAALAPLAADLGATALIVDLQHGTEHTPWLDAAAWVLTRFGPYDLDERIVREVIEAGP
jgi:alkanesulfonate monooxygenase SsuD/methylene tetrahydromethanopterin reductase-like flavin-dependent oxidoreductase (luciferase family)